MKTYFLGLIFILLTTSLYSDSLWVNNYKEALKIAKKQNKDIYLFIGADTCKFCDRFRKTTLSKKHVIQTLKQDYVLLYLSRDRDTIPQQYSTTAVPKHYFITKDEKIIFDAYGMPEPSGFFLMLDEAELNRED